MASIRPPGVETDPRMTLCARILDGGVRMNDPYGSGGDCFVRWKKLTKFAHLLIEYIPDTLDTTGFIEVEGTRVYARGVAFVEAPRIEALEIGLTDTSSGVVRITGLYG